MVGIVRATAKLFATTGLTPVGGFAAAANGTVTTEVGSLNSLSNIQGGQPGEWAAGWLSATQGSSKFPAIEDMNAVDSVFSTQIAYILERGIAEYDSGTSYNIGDVTRRAATAQTYKSLTDANTGNALPTVPYSSANWQYCGDLSTRVALTAAATFYVASTGNDSNTGAVGSPWLTIQHAVNYIVNNIDTCGQDITISVGDATYTGATLMNQPLTGGGTLTIVGNIATPANCTVSTTSANCFEAANNAVFNLKGFKLQTTTGGDCVHAEYGGTIYITDNMTYGACAGYHIQALSGGRVNVSHNYTISAAALAHWAAVHSGGSTILANGLTITVSGTPAFGNQFALADGGQIICVSDTFSGSATGVRFTSQNNGVINTAGGGADYLPGNSAGAGTNPGASPYGLYV